MYPHRVTVPEIITIVCKTLSVSESELCGRGRHKLVCLARTIVWDQIRRRHRLSYPEIARATGRIGVYGKPAHSTILEGCNRLMELADCRAFEVLGCEEYARVMFGVEATVADVSGLTDVAIEAFEAKADGDTKRLGESASLPAKAAPLTYTASGVPSPKSGRPRAATHGIVAAVAPSNTNINLTAATESGSRSVSGLHLTNTLTLSQLATHIEAEVGGLDNRNTPAVHSPHGTNPDVLVQAVEGTHQAD